MQLQSMIISGFKSFQEAKLEFPKGITSVVGPNGSGKSNVVDAILWVLGEQSTKALRSERMEDVIFNGTETRKALGMAEVSLIVNDVTSQELEAVAGLIEDIPGTKELMITRRLYRDGESEYLINKIPCRLKDIRSLFLEARAGTKGHTVIEQGNIEQILSASPQERRGFIEETAGIGRYKKQKTEALRKLHSTEQNLVRVRDVIAEVKRQLRTLERQARQAEVYKALRQESRQLEMQVLRSDFLELSAQRESVETSLRICEEAETEMMSQEARLMADYERQKEDVLQKGELAASLQASLRKVEQDMAQTLTHIEVQRNRLHHFEEQQGQAKEEASRLAGEIEEAQGRIRSLEEQVIDTEEDIVQHVECLKNFEEEEREISHRRNSTQQQIDSTRQRNFDITLGKTQAENQLRSLAERREVLTKRIERLSSELKEYTEQRDRLAIQLDDRRVQLQDLTSQLGNFRERREQEQETLERLEVQVQELDAALVGQQTDLAGAESRLHALRAIFQEEFGYGQPADGGMVSIRESSVGIREALAERIEVPEYLENAIEAVLGEKLRSWGIDHVGEAVQAVAYFKEQKLGRGTFVPLVPVSRKHGEEPYSPTWWTSLQHCPGVVGRALDLVRYPEELSSAWGCLLTSVVIVQDLNVAISLVEDGSWGGDQRPQFVTLAGEVVTHHGVVVGGSAGESAGLLQRRREIRMLEESVDEQVHHLEHNRQTRRIKGSESDVLKSRIQDLDESSRQLEMRIMMEEKELSGLNQDLDKLNQQLHVLGQERDASRLEQHQVDQEEGIFRDKLVQFQQEDIQQQEEWHLLLSSMEELETQAAENHGQVTEARLTVNTFRERLDRYHADLMRMRQEDETRQTRLQTIDRRLEQLAHDQQTGQEEQVRSESAYRELEQKQISIQSELSGVKEQHDAGLTKSRAVEQELQGMRKQFAETREKRGGVEVRLAEIRTRLASLQETVEQTYELALEEFLTPSPESGSEHDQDREAQSENHQAGWRERLHDIRTRLDRMGPINLAAIEEHRELEERHGFLTKQEQDLSESIRSLQEIIERLNQTTNQRFEETFQVLQEKFSEVFSALFAGGKAELILVKPETDQESGEFQEDPGVDIVAQPPGKRLKTLAMLSGGEKSLTVLALMFASFLIKPSPFCILDEVDAPLDEANVVRFARFLSQMSDRSQFVVITHNKRTMEVADSLFGVTMEEPGVSKFVAVRLADLEPVSR